MEPVGKKIFIFILILAAPWAATAVDFSSQQECLEYHRQQLDQRNQTAQCKGQNQSACQNQYGEDYVSSIEKTCRQYFSSKDTEVTTPTQQASDCSNATRSQLQASANSCLSLGEVSGTRCSTEESQRVIQLAGRRAETATGDATSLQKTCQEMQNFSSQAESAMRSFEQRCEPAITEGQAVCARAQQMIQTSSCAATVKNQLIQTVNKGVAMFSTHNSTLNNARQNVQSARQSGTETAACLAQTASAAQSLAAKDKTAATTNSSTETPAEMPTTGHASSPSSPGGSSSPALTASPSAAPGSDSSTGRGGGGTSASSGNSLWDLPRTPATADGSGNSGAGAAAGELGKDTASKPNLETPEEQKTSRADDSDSGSTSSGGRGGRGWALPAPNEKFPLSDGSLAKDKPTAEELPDLSRFRPQGVGLSGQAVDSRRGSCSAVARDGITGPHCSQWEKIHNRYRFLRTELVDSP